jgi:succinate dehydrogenase / fumarate reductase membrane anchor subunit
MKYATDLHMVRGLGSAKSGLHHWIAQRITAIALIPLGIWFVYTFILLVTSSYDMAHQWLTSPWTATLSILFVFLIFYHGTLGLRVIWEDYVPRLFLRWALIMGTQLLSTLMAAIAILSIVKVFLS